jgi:hypothetical protein
MSSAIERRLTAKERLDLALQRLADVRDEVRHHATQKGPAALERFQAIDAELHSVLSLGWPTGTIVDALAQKLRELDANLGIARDG